MLKHNKTELIAQLAFYLVGFYIFIKIVIPIINPVTVATDLNGSSSAIYEKIISSSVPAVKVVMDSYEDEDKKDLFSIIFKYITKIDLSNPKTYIASEIPLLQFIDITSIVSDENGPTVVVPKPDDQGKDSKGSTGNTGNISTGNSSSSGSGDTTPSSDGSNPTTVNPKPSSSPAAGKLNPAKPQVLIYHTHTTECYNPSNVKEGNFSTDLSKGVAEVGDILKKELENQYHISTIHDSTIHDIPTRGGGYAKSRITLDKYLKKYSSFKIIIDLHRDGTNSKNATTARIGNDLYSRVAFVIGSANRNFSKNEAFVKKLNEELNEFYPGLSRGLIYLKNSKFNQDLAADAVLIEVGSNKNSLIESERTIKIIAKMIAKLIEQ